MDGCSFDFAFTCYLVFFIPHRHAVWNVVAILGLGEAPFFMGSFHEFVDSHFADSGYKMGGPRNCSILVNLSNR